MSASVAKIVEHPLKEMAEKEFVPASDGTPVRKENHERTRFRVVSAKGVHFQGVSFKYCLFEDCYFRDCRFEDCDFTGASFRNSNLRGSTFDGSRFDYCRFAHTLVPQVVLERHMPGYENVALELARALRVNYAQTGDSVGVNKAISAELDATRIHLHKAAWSKESYYRSKHHGWGRLAKIAEYCWFRLLDGIWGHGESLPKLLRTGLVCYVAVAWRLYRPEIGVIGAVRDSFLLFWGSTFSRPLLGAVAVALRTLLLGLFVTVLVRRLSRR
ncbi:MAG TPA: pentapeptide repeat-containing protein [Lacunisphaera sp.]|jgi:hypothetical protein